MIHWACDWLLVGLAFTGWLAAIDGGLEQDWWCDGSMLAILAGCALLGPLWAIGIFVLWLFNLDPKAHPGRGL